MTPILLIVDDEKSTRDGLRAAFEEKFDVYVAPDVAGALQILESEAVDVVLTDLRMAGEDGLALLSLMSAKEPSARPTARQCLQHAWFDPVRETAADAFGDRTLLDVMVMAAAAVDGEKG